MYVCLYACMYVCHEIGFYIRVYQIFFQHVFQHDFQHDVLEKTLETVLCEKIPNIENKFCMAFFFSFVGFSDTSSVLVFIFFDSVLLENVLETMSETSDTKIFPNTTLSNNKNRVGNRVGKKSETLYAQCYA